MNFEEIKNLDKEYIIQSYGRYQIALEKGKGAYVWSPDGKEYLDFLCGLGVTSLGHAHPAINEVIKSQIDTLTHTSNLYYSEKQVLLAKKISQLTFKGKTFFCNSGTEANEAAIKYSRKRGNAIRAGKNKLLSLTNSFHGRTMGSISLTGQTKYQKGFEPLLTNIEYIERNNINDLEKKFSNDVCAVFIEAIQGESGIYPIDNEFIYKADELCRKHDALLVFDEVQCGVGRTGKIFAFQHTGITPHIFTCAKALANGVPAGLMHVREDVSGIFAPGNHAATFGGNFLVCSIALKVLEIMENILPESELYAEKLLSVLKELSTKYSFIKEIRNKGFMFGISLDINARELLDKCHENGLLCNAIGDNILRMLPPVIIRDKEIEDFKKRFTASIKHF